MFRVTGGSLLAARLKCLPERILSVVQRPVSVVSPAIGSFLANGGASRLILCYKFLNKLKTPPHAGSSLNDTQIYFFFLKFKDMCTNVSRVVRSSCHKDCELSSIVNLEGMGLVIDCVDFTQFFFF